MFKSIPMGTFKVVAASLVAVSLVGFALKKCLGRPAFIAVDQGSSWTPALRDEFYSLDQGSRIIQLRWIMALKLPDGSPFMADSLRRYGYLPNPASPAKLPVGFTAAGDAGKEEIGMTCAACHTRQIEVGGTAYRIDGGPAIVDFQSFMSDLDVAVGAVLGDEKAFADFARAVLGGGHTPADAAALRMALGDWDYRNHTLMANSLPRGNHWGPGRVDAIGMIFNRLTGLDLGPEPSRVIKENIEPAEAPTRYPFLWNAWKQNKTQWTGFAPNNNPFVRLARNIGQVLGVFAKFAPTKDPSKPGVIDYLKGSSVNCKGLKKLEALTMDIGPPRWPWAIDDELAKMGQPIYETKCQDCHGAANRTPPWKTKITPIKELLTDFRALALVQRSAYQGVLKGEPPFGTSGSAAFILFGSVLSYESGNPDCKSRDPSLDVQVAAIAEADQKREYLAAGRAIANTGWTTTNREFGNNDGYAARVLQGVWAAAPYLHNGSVPTLADLLEPTSKRPPSFKIGSAYDPKTVGLAKEQTQFGATLMTTDCSDRGSGNSRCGHEGPDYGTELSILQKRALLEYLKKL